jgi:hypothetical protein
MLLLAGKSERKMKRFKRLIIFFVSLMLLFAFVMWLFYALDASRITDLNLSSPTPYDDGSFPEFTEGFNLMHISDTQILSEYEAGWADFTGWISSVASTWENVKMVIHTGDIVEHWDNLTEWDIANASMGVLFDAGVPYCWCGGNHDAHFASPYEYYGIDYASFNPARFESEDYWLSSYNDGRNTAVNFTYGGYKFLIINLDWHCNSTAMTWFTDILDANTDSNVVVATHSYINKTGGYDLGLGRDVWELALKEILDAHSNVMFTLNGHDSGVFRITVNGRESMLFNHQGQSKYARVLTFDVAKERVYVRTYDYYTSSWIEDWDNRFSFSVDLI